MQEPGAYFGASARAQRIGVVFGEILKTLAEFGIRAGPVLLTADEQAWTEVQGGITELPPTRSFCLGALPRVPLFPWYALQVCAFCLFWANSGVHGAMLERSLQSAGSVLNLDCALGPDEPPYSLMLQKLRDRHDLAALNAVATRHWRTVGVHAHEAGGPVIQLPQLGHDARDG